MIAGSLLWVPAISHSSESVEKVVHDRLGKDRNDNVVISITVVHSGTSDYIANMPSWQSG
jgi:hypothetical protein